MARVLMLAYEYPPLAGGGIQRTVKFVRYLPDFLWTPVVLTPNWSSTGDRPKDDSFSAEVGDGQVMYTGDPVPRSRLWELLLKTPGGWRWVPTLRENLAYPDRVAVWKHDVVRTAARLLREEHFDVLYTTSPPVTAHVAGAILKRRFKIPWVADFRDPWTDNRIAYRRIWRLRRSFDRRLERGVYALADALIANTPMNRKVMTDRHGIAPGKILAIPNGYDEADFDKPIAHRPCDAFRITYCGAAYANYNPKAFGDILRSFLKAQPGSKIRWTVAGEASRWASETQGDLLANGSLEILGYLPHHQVPPLLMSSHLLVHANPQNLEYHVPGKLYEYLRSGTPILALCDRPSEVARVLQETGRGRAFTHDEKDHAAHWLAQLYARWESREDVYENTPSERVALYERRHLTSRLATLLDVVRARRPAVTALADDSIAINAQDRF